MATDIPERQRLFIALYPDDSARHRLHQLALELAQQPGARVVPQANLHLTLRFLGTVEASTRACLQQELERIRGQRFKLRFEYLEFRKRQQMLWASVPNIPDGLIELVERVEQSSISCGLAASDHAFRPHVTLARKVHRAIVPRRIEELETWIEEFYLVRSETLPEGSRYTRLKGWSLNSSGAE